MPFSFPLLTLQLFFHEISVSNGTATRGTFYLLNNATLALQ
jgi:hypothetical protein